MIGMILHVDGSKHRWFQDDRYYDLLVILDDGTSEIYYAQLVEEESTRTVMAGLPEVIATQGYSVRCTAIGQPLLCDPKGWREGRPAPVDASGTSDPKSLNPNDPGVLTAGARPLRARIRYVAESFAAGTSPGGDSHAGRGKPVLAGSLHG
jgi:hypothetical protein